MQEQLDLIESFLHLTTETFDYWHWDGSELIIILKKVVLERYSKEDLMQIIEGF